MVCSSEAGRQETVNRDLKNKKYNTYNQNNNNTSGINSIIPPTGPSPKNTDYHFDKRDFDNYMDDLGNKLQKNWFPPENSYDTAVTVSIDIAKDGRLLNVGVKKSSGVLLIDTSAINAVKASAPFNPLPPQYKGNSINIHFTFDYNNYQKNWII